MRRTLLLIPHEIASVPLFGFGLLFALLVLAALIVSIRVVRQGGSLLDHWSRSGLIWALSAAAIVWGVPAIELTNIDGDPVGLPVRGYGVMLLLGVVAAVALAIARGRRYGLRDEFIWGLAPWAIVGGLIGARAFYVIEYRDQFFVSDPLTTLRRIANFTEGGLVVYGSFIGGFLAGWIHVHRNRVSALTVGDVVLPTMLLGLALGRIGCLLNGCCYGGSCQDGWAALHFPNGSPVYQDQLASGGLVGIELSADRTEVLAVRPGSLAAARGILPGQTVGHFNVVRSIESADPRRPAEETPFGLVAEIDGREHYWSALDLPTTANPVWPTQIISAIGAITLCVMLCFASRFVTLPGVILFAGAIGYAIMRFLIERLRSDEPGQFGTQLTISQWVSLIVFVVSAVSLIALAIRGQPIRPADSSA